jgi:hypothetical protein
MSSVIEKMNQPYLDLVRAMTPKQLQDSFRVDFPNIDTFLECSWKDEIDVQYFVDERNTGWGRMKVQRSSIQGRVEYDRFYPHKNMHEMLKHLGIGTLAHISTLVKLIEDVPEIDATYEVFHNPLKTSDDYQGLLAKIGVNLSEPIEHYLERCVAYANNRGFQFTDPLRQR